MFKQNILRACGTLFAVGVLTACATSYQARGFTGGFTDTRIDDATWRVRFDGNGHARQDRVWNFWLYRCAELTLAKGYTAMAIETRPADPPRAPAAPATPAAPAPSSSLAPPQSPVSWTDDGHRQGGDWRMRKTPYTRADATPQAEQVAARAPTYIYVPGQTITTWHADGIVHMFNESSVPLALRAWMRPSRIIELLKPYVESDGKAVAPSREYILSQAIVVVRKPDAGKSF